MAKKKKQCNSEMDDEYKSSKRFTSKEDPNTENKSTDTNVNTKSTNTIQRNLCASSMENLKLKYGPLVLVIGIAIKARFL